jgi:hypothetical protein
MVTDDESELNPEGESEPIREAARRTEDVLEDLAEVDEMHHDVETFLNPGPRKKRTRLHKLAIVLFAGLGLPSALMLFLSFLSKVYRITGIQPFASLWIPWNETPALFDTKFALGLLAFIITAFFFAAARMEKAEPRAPRARRRSPFSRLE